MQRFLLLPACVLLMAIASPMTPNAWTAEAKEKAAVTAPEKAARDEGEEEEEPAVENAGGKAVKPAADAAAKKKVVAGTKKEAAKDAKKEAKKKPAVVRLTISGDYPEGPTALGMFGESQPSLSAVVEKLDQAAADKGVAALWLRIEGLALGRGKISELRAAVARVRKAGKPVYAEMSSGEGPAYLLASACDKVVMPPSGLLVLPGVRAEVTFYKGLLDKLGLQFDMLQMGKYKGAAEPMTRTAMSGPLRESMEAMIDDIYEDFAATIAADRKMKDHRVKTLMDDALFTAAKAKKAGLVDEVLYADELEAALRKRLGGEIEIVTNYKKKQVDADFSGVGGALKLMEVMMGGKAAEKASKGKKIAVVYLTGPIVDGKSTSDMLGGSSVGSSTLVAAIKKAADDPKVLAVVVRVDSPGGSAVASDLIWRQLKKCGKPVVASMGDVAASGGYYVAVAADTIFAEPGTVTGSIGVVGGKMVVGGLYDKIGLSTEVISRGEKSGSFSALKPFSDEERKAWTGMLQETYRQFVDKAAQGRKMKREKLEELAQGRVYTGRMAAANGLVDRIGTLEDAIVAAKKAAGLQESEEVEILTLPKAQTIFEQLFGESPLSGELRTIAPEATQALRRAGIWQQLLTSGAPLTWMPYDVQLR